MEWKVTGEVWNERAILDAVIRYQPPDGTVLTDEEDSSRAEQAVRTLIDTGSTHSALNADIVAALNLEFLMETTHTSFDTKDRVVKCYKGAVAFGEKPQIETPNIIFVPRSLPDTFQPILGMDFIKYATWQFNPDGKFSATIDLPDD